MLQNKLVESPIEILNGWKKAVLVRYGELSLKSESTRRFMENVLIRNIKWMLNRKKVPYDSIFRERGRIFLSSDSPRMVAQVLSSVFGVVSTSPVLVTSSEMDEIIRLSERVADVLIKPNDSFAIRARRVGTHSFTSIDVEKKVGEVILARTRNLNTKVNLTQPDKCIFIEVREKKTYIYHEVFPGPGGLPYNSEGKMVALFSGGIDSPVAMWLMMKRGCKVVPIYFDNTPYTDESNYNRTMSVIKILREYATQDKFYIYIVPHGKILEKAITQAPRRLTCLLCKRAFYRVATIIAEKENAKGIITGESLGQVASQTLDNLMVLNEATHLPVFRPLIGLDKLEIEGTAKKIGTYEASCIKTASCSAVPDKPRTKAKQLEVKKAEKELMDTIQEESNLAKRIYIE
ncbi:MAG: tRNA 4-thiouridine(8) synthase ThiI [Candidatus Freyarchaeota archaeon]|nr:tRNA 4-thiouridine(8) synthase ThiI [Candidatus Jordarchaeia archaeon]